MIIQILNYINKQQKYMQYRITFNYKPVNPGKQSQILSIQLPPFKQPSKQPLSIAGISHLSPNHAGEHLH